MQSKTLQANVASPGSANPGDDELSAKVQAAPDKLAGKQDLSKDNSDYGISLQTKLKNQFKAMGELKDKKKVLEDILKEAEEQNTVIQEILEEMDEKKELLKAEREQFKAEHLETVDKLKELKKELKEESELLSDMLLVAYERGEEVILEDKDGRRFTFKVQAKLTAKK